MCTHLKTELKIHKAVTDRNEKQNRQTEQEETRGGAVLASLVPLNRSMARLYTFTGGVCVRRWLSHVRLCDPMDCSPPGCMRV